MPRAPGLRFHCVLAWILLPAAPSWASATLRRRAAVEELLVTPTPQAHIAVEMREEVRIDGLLKTAMRWGQNPVEMRKAPHSLHLSLANLGLPVPPEVRDLAAQADGSQRVTPAEADHATETLNKMIEEQHWLLDHKVVDCREKRRNAGEAIQNAAEEVRNLAAETSAARGIIVEAASRIPQDRRSFNEIKVDAEVSRTRCQGAGLSGKVKAASLSRDAAFVYALQQALKQQCPGGASFLQEPVDDVDDVIADAEKSLHDVDTDTIPTAAEPIDTDTSPSSTDTEPMGLSQSAAAEEPSHDIDDVISSAERALHSGHTIHALKLKGRKAKSMKKLKGRKVKSMKVVGCEGVAAALGILAKKHGGPAAVAFVQQLQPTGSCKLTPHDCAAMHDVAAEVAGEIADSQARLRANSARQREECKEEDSFAKGQLAMETSQASDRSRELGEATWKAGKVGDLAIEKDSERQTLQKDLKALTGKCTTEISDILYGKMCSLQKVRDSLQVLAGRQELPEDCQVTDWDAGVCSATCGGGKKVLTRKVALTAKGGAACPPLQLHLSCGETACPKDCEVATWSGWSACSARCDGGIQERNRVVSSKPVGNGVACPHLVEMQICNTEACNSDCKLLEWTSWSPCSQACGGGTQQRSRGLRDEGRTSCPNRESQDRLEFRECNHKQCGDSDEVSCAGAPLDVVLLLDASGTITEAGFSALKQLSLELVRQYARKDHGTKLAVAAFAEKATSISALTDDANALSDRISSKMHWLQGPNNVGSALLRASSLLSAGGRMHTSSIVLMLTDGRLIDPFLARQAADRLKKSGTRIVFGLVGKDYKNMRLLKSMASSPEKENIIQLDGFHELPNSLQKTAKRIVTGTCSAVV